MLKLGFIGCGNMATAIIGGAVTSEFLKGNEICVFDVDSSKAEFLNKAYGVNVCSAVEKLSADCEFVVLAVKPQVFPTVLPQIKDSLNNTLHIAVSRAHFVNHFVYRILKFSCCCQIVCFYQFV